MAGWLPTVGSFAIPAVSLLIFFLAYTSQYLFYHLQPGPLSWGEALWFNGCVLCIWWCYDRACTADPGRKGWVQNLPYEVYESGVSGSGDPRLEKGMRWCKKCEAVKPPRAHHCRQCGRYGPFSSYSHGHTDQLSQMHPKDGSPLPVDIQLRLPHDLSPFHPLRLLCCPQHVHPGLPSLQADRPNLE